MKIATKCGSVFRLAEIHSLYGYSLIYGPLRGLRLTSRKAQVPTENDLFTIVICLYVSINSVHCISIREIPVNTK